MANEQKRDAMRDFLSAWTPPLMVNDRDLDDALYMISELSLWPDGVDSVSRKQALLCWVLVERLRTQMLPDELKM